MSKRKVTVEELEHLIEQYVFERVPCDDWATGRFGWQGGWMRTDKCQHEHDKCYWSQQTVQYARNANATRVVIDKLRSEGFLFSFRDYPDFRVAEFQREGGFPHTARGRYDDGVVTCLAALATRGIYVEVE